MPKRSIISPVERRSWMEQNEQGTRIDRIAKAAGRTERTVSAHIDQGRQEREDTAVRASLLREAYKVHHQELLSVHRVMEERCQEPHSHGLITGHSSNVDLLLYQGLRAHVPRSRIWPSIRAWEDCSSQLAETLHLSAAVAARFLEEHELAAVPEALKDGFVGALAKAATMSPESLDPLELKCRWDTSGGKTQVIWDSFILAEWTKGEAGWPEAEEEHRALLRRILDSEASKSAKSFWLRWAEARDVIREEALMLRLRHMLPGRCNLCPGGEGTQRGRPRKKRRKAEE